MTRNRIKDFLRYIATGCRTMGFVPTLQWVFGTVQSNLKISRPLCRKVRPRFLSHPVNLRACSSDFFVFRQIMIENEYLPLASQKVTTLIDLGANIGLSSAWFLSHFPNSKSFAVEADSSNYGACVENLAPYGDRARVLLGAAWSTRGPLALHRWSSGIDTTVEPIGPDNEPQESVQGYDIATLIEMSGFEQVDILKIDIEEAEAAVFSADISSWAGRVRNLCIELHGQRCRDVFFHAMEHYDYNHSVSGELDLCTDIQPKTGAKVIA